MVLPEVLTYKDFKIELTDLDDAQSTFKLRVLELPGHDGMRAEETELVTLDRAAINEFVSRLEQRTLKSGKFLEFGKILGQMLLPGKALDLFNMAIHGLGANEGLRLRLSIEPLALAAIPWEYALI